MQSHVDFAYPRYLTYGHLVIAAILLPIVTIAVNRKWSKVFIAGIAALVVRSITAFLVVLLGFAPNGRMALPTELRKIACARPDMNVKHVGGARAAAHIVLRKRA